MSLDDSSTHLIMGFGELEDGATDPSTGIVYSRAGISVSSSGFAASSGALVPAVLGAGGWMLIEGLPAITAGWARMIEYSVSKDLPYVSPVNSVVMNVDYNYTDGNNTNQHRCTGGATTAAGLTYSIVGGTSTPILGSQTGTGMTWGGVCTLGFRDRPGGHAAIFSYGTYPGSGNNIGYKADIESRTNTDPSKTRISIDGNASNEASRVGMWRINGVRIYDLWMMP